MSKKISPWADTLEPCPKPQAWQSTDNNEALDSLCHSIFIFVTSKWLPPISASNLNAILPPKMLALHNPS